MEVSEKAASAAEVPQERLGEVWEVDNGAPGRAMFVDSGGGVEGWVVVWLVPGGDCGWRSAKWVRLHATRRLHEGMAPPRPEVPTKRGAIVRLEDGSEWVNTTHQPEALYAPWLCVAPTTPSRWQSLDHIATNITEVLFEGIDDEGGAS